MFKNAMKYGGIILGKLEDEIKRRRTFAIISHPDAGKTTLTEKFLLYGGAIAQAGAVKGKKNSRHAVSDWMEIEKQRGISVTSSVMQFQYKNYCINILDTPGHQDFSEDTYRTLMAADSAVMVIDASKGVENQTRKLFKVCVMRHIPIFTFVNKMDRESRNPFDLMEQIESELGIQTYPVNWPIGSGKEFKGVYDRDKKHIVTVDPLDLEASVAAVKECADIRGVKAIIFKSPCIAITKPSGKMEISEKCIQCKKCIREIGCPAIILKDGKVAIDESLCTGCGLCSQICPVGAIGGACNE